MWHIPLFLPLQVAALGVAYTLERRVAEGLALAEQGVEQAVANGRPNFLATVVACLSEAYLLAGRLEDARQRAARLSTSPARTSNAATRPGRCGCWVRDSAPALPRGRARRRPLPPGPSPWPRSWACARSRRTATAAWARCSDDRSAGAGPCRVLRCYRSLSRHGDDLLDPGNRGVAGAGDSAMIMGKTLSPHRVTLRPILTRVRAITDAACVLPVCDTKTLCGTWPLAMLTGLTALSPLACRPSGVLAAGLRRSVTGHSHHLLVTCVPARHAMSLESRALPPRQRGVKAVKTSWSNARRAGSSMAAISLPTGKAERYPRRSVALAPNRIGIVETCTSIACKPASLMTASSCSASPQLKGLHKGEATRDVPGHPTDADRGPPTRLHERADALAHATPARPPGPLA